jgi:hypothetical protein
LRSLLARADQEAMAVASSTTRCSACCPARSSELAQCVAHRGAVACAACAPVDELIRRAVRDRPRQPPRHRGLALKALGCAAAAGHATISVQHVVAARKELWP